MAADAIRDPREEAELRMRALLDDSGLPQPDRVEYGDTAIWLYWDEQQLVVEVAQIPPGCG